MSSPPAWATARAQAPPALITSEYDIPADADVQFCQNSDKRLTKRMGLIKSKVGFGVDYKWKPNVLYSIDFIDTQNTQVETTSVYKIRENVSIQSKVENALKKKERNYNVGVQYNF